MGVSRLFLIVPFAVMALQGHAQAATSCMRATHALAMGTVPTADDLVAADCGEAKHGSVVRYDGQMRAVRLARNVQANEIVDAVPSAMLASISPGEKLYVNILVSPVVVQREVEALQPAYPGQKLFVRAADGKVFSVLYPGDAK